MDKGRLAQAEHCIDAEDSGSTPEATASIDLDGDGMKSRHILRRRE